MSTDLKDKFTVLKVDGLLIGCKGLILFFNISHTFEIIGLILSSLTTGRGGNDAFHNGCVEEYSGLRSTMSTSGREMFGSPRTS
jgi:hypothetical protein